MKLVKLRNTRNQVAYLHVAKGHHTHAKSQRQPLHRCRVYPSQKFDLLNFILDLIFAVLKWWLIELLIDCMQFLLSAAVPV